MFRLPGPDPVKHLRMCLIALLDWGLEDDNSIFKFSKFALTPHWKENKPSPGTHAGTLGHALYVFGTLLF